jgi:hypothetical protein
MVIYGKCPSGIAHFNDESNGKLTGMTFDLQI